MKKDFFEMYCPSCGTKNRIRTDLASLSVLSVECGQCHYSMPISPIELRELTSDDGIQNKEEGYSILQKYGIITVIFFLTRFSLDYISNDSIRIFLLIGLFISFVLIPFLRKIFFQVMLVIILAVSLFYGIVNYKEIKRGKVTFLKATKDVIEYIFLFGPMKQIKAIMSYENYGRYLSKVDPRNKEINLLASTITKPCKDNDHLCEASLILRFVTNEISYREDPHDGDDYIKDPLDTLKSKSGDCEDQTILLISLLESVGKKSYMIFT